MGLRLCLVHGSLLVACASDHAAAAGAGAGGTAVERGIRATAKWVQVSLCDKPVRCISRHAQRDECSEHNPKNGASAKLFLGRGWVIVTTAGVLDGNPLCMDLVLREVEAPICQLFLLPVHNDIHLRILLSVAHFCWGRIVFEIASLGVYTDLLSGRLPAILCATSGVREATLQ